MCKLLNIRRDENGSTILIFVFILFLMLGVGGLAVDAGALYKAKGEMRKAADAAALSGAQVMFVDDATVTDTVNSILAANKENNCNLVLNIKPGGANKVTVKLDKTVSTYFMKIFGVSSVPISVTSSAMAGPLGGASGVLPIAVSDASVYVPGNDYPINYTSGSGLQGNFGYLDFTSVYKADGSTKVTDPNPDINGKGAPTLNYFLQSGFGPEIDYNYTIYSETGVKKQTAYNGMISQLNKTVIILLYDHNDTFDFAGKSSPVHITGFAFFTIDSVNSDTNLVTGKFVEKVTSGSINDSAKDWGAYAIKLVE
jgi:Flp pilus assembly protein TadG